MVQKKEKPESKPSSSVYTEIWIFILWDWSNIVKIKLIITQSYFSEDMKCKWQSKLAKQNNNLKKRSKIGGIKQTNDQTKYLQHRHRQQFSDSQRGTGWGEGEMGRWG